MRNGSKKRKQHQKLQLKRAALIEDALRDAKTKAESSWPNGSIASKYYKLWRRSVDVNEKLQTKLDNRASTNKVYSIFNANTFHQSFY
jgi:hypothetical protein